MGEKAAGRVAIVSLTIAAVIPLVQFALLFPMTLDIPSWDQWSEVEPLAAHYEHRPVLPLLLKPYNGHFNVLPRMFLYVLALATRWNVRMEVVASYLVCAATLAILIAMLRETDSTLLILAAPAAAYVFSLIQFTNFLSGYSFGQNLSILASVLALFLLTRRDSSRKRFGLALVSAVVASLSFGGGNAVWFAGVFVIATGSERRAARLAVWCAAGFGGLFLARMATQSAAMHVNWRTVVPFFFAVLGRPYVPVFRLSLRLAAGVGFGASLVFLSCAGWAVRDRNVRGDSLRRWLSVGFFGLGSAGLIAMARSTAPPRQALASHYSASTAFLGVATFALVSMWLELRLPRPTLRLPAIGLTAIVALALPVMASVAWLPILRGDTVIRRQDAWDLTDGTIEDARIRQSIHPNPERVRRDLPILRKYRLAMFREKE